MSFAEVISQLCEEKLGVRGVKLKEGSKFSGRVTAETMECVDGFTNRIRKEFIFHVFAEALEVLYKQNVSVLVV